ncbi:globin [Lujinxingia litoralis]|uniref:Globin n=1 Tax=Lujinxingia litoralis TaxID=2211119 RepID=A0A328CBW2_9DELT|nr:group II truncated hemoglobin [Lujinxingia litoralis]RAL23007.1 globin [Lujinxingia litoralis]
MTQPPPEDTTPFELVGGTEGVQKLVDRFYDLMDTLPEAATIRAMHARSLKVSREKLVLFLTGWLGGPPLYMEKYGHPRLRMRHAPFDIDEDARQAWMLCMRQALDEQVEDAQLRRFLDQALDRVAAHMRNMH